MHSKMTEEWNFGLFFIFAFGLIHSHSLSLFGWNSKQFSSWEIRFRVSATYLVCVILWFFSYYPFFFPDYLCEFRNNLDHAVWFFSFYSFSLFNFILFFFFLSNSTLRFAVFRRSLAPSSAYFIQVYIQHDVCVFITFYNWCSFCPFTFIFVFPLNFWYFRWILHEYYLENWINQKGNVLIVKVF